MFYRDCELAGVAEEQQREENEEEVVTAGEGSPGRGGGPGERQTAAIRGTVTYRRK